MVNQATIETLKEMRLGAMAATFDEQLKNPEGYRDFNFEERFGLIVDAEWTKRQGNKLARYINLTFAFFCTNNSKCLYLQTIEPSLIYSTIVL